MIFMSNNNFYLDTGKKTHIVIHGTAGGNSAIEIAQFFKGTEGGKNPVSTHYIIGQDGQIVQTVLEKDGSWGNGSTEWNNKAISIEHVKSTPDNSAQLTVAQENASFNLIKDICQRNGIPYENILPHHAIYNTACPGPYPWDRLKIALQGKPMKQGPSANQLIAANNRWDSIVHSIRKGSGIYNAWLLDYANGIYHGPPMSMEYSSIDWSGNPITVQEFMYGWCEWYNGTAHWYPN
jgi:N-acetyl-anhydromuramyl-L-alanine amidase AmpD